MKCIGAGEAGCDYNALMSIRTRDYLDAIEHLPQGGTLVLQQFSWDDYERLLDRLIDRHHLRISYDRGRIEIMSPLPKHEKYARLIDQLVGIFAEELDVELESYGSATWKRRTADRGHEPDCCYYVASAASVIGKDNVDLESDPPPDIAVEIDITNESFSKFAIYAALRVPEIWRYDEKKLQFYELADTSYCQIAESRFLPGLKPETLMNALTLSKTVGQRSALRSFRKTLDPSIP